MTTTPSQWNATQYPEQIMRAAFAGMLTEVGPDAPTLCEGWTCRDLAIHLVLIERRPESWLGIMIGDRISATRSYFDGLVDRERERPWDELVGRVAAGPSRGPLGNAKFRNNMMFREYTVHGEDVRRPNALPAIDHGPAVAEKIWEKAQSFGRFVRTAKPYGLEIANPDGPVHQVRKGTATARVTGTPIDVLLYEFGRTEGVDLEFSGDPDAVASVRVRTTNAPSLPRVR